MTSLSATWTADAAGAALRSAAPLALPLSGPAPPPPFGWPFSQMVLVAWDGAQLAHTEELIQSGKLPNLATIAQQGGLAPTYITDHGTGTLAGFAQILTGYPPTLTGAYGIENYTPIPRRLTVFYRLKQHFGGDITTVFVASKGERLGSTPGAPYSLALPDIDVFDGDTTRYMDESGPIAVDKVRTYAQPGTSFFIFLDFFEPDWEGHTYGENSPEYEAALIGLDDWLGRILQALADNGVASTTAVCVTTDHGFQEDGKVHVDCFDSWLAANWTALLPGDQKDITPTILAGYGVDLAEVQPRLPGRPLWEPAAPAVPVVYWEGHRNFEADGIHPDAGILNRTRFKFTMRLHDRDGDEPAWVRLAIRRNGEHWRTLTMAPDGWSTMAQRTYAIRLKDPPPPGRYTYRVRAKDDDGYACGPAARWQPGPCMLPKLVFVRSPEFRDGVTPNSGRAEDTLFNWKVTYRDNDGDMPKVVQLRTWRNGEPFRVTRMTTANPNPDPAAGVVYGCRRGLPAGDYAYRFEAQDKDGWATGLPSRKMTGLTVTPVTSLALANLGLLPTGAGAQITFTLSSAAQVRARILNIAGRPVKTLCRAKDCESGANTLLWKAQANNGLRVPNGTYLVEVTAKAADGTRARGMGQVRISR